MKWVLVFIVMSIGTDGELQLDKGKVLGSTLTLKKCQELGAEKAKIIGTLYEELGEENIPKFHMQCMENKEDEKRES